jgi:single-strand DNA-binding protein
LENSLRDAAKPPPSITFRPTRQTDTIVSAECTSAHRLGQNAEAKTDQNNREYVVLNIATQESWKNEKGDYETRTEWHRVFAWRNLSKFAKTLQKGQLITLEGTLRYREVEDEIEGTTFKHRIAEVHAISMKRLSKIEAADDPADGRRRVIAGFRWMRQRKSHPPFVVKIEAGCEIEYAQIVLVSASLGLSHCIN